MCRIACKLLLIVTLAALPAFAQSPQGETSPKLTEANNFPDSSEGLRQMLIHVSIAARGADAASQLPALIKDMEVPDYRNWAIAAFGKKPGKSWAKSYAKDLASEEKLMAERFVFWGGEDGEFFVWKVGKDSKSPGGQDEAYTQNVVQPLDVFYAEWRRSARSPSEGADPVGYFLFIDGKFRWDNTVERGALPGANAGRQLSCSYCPPPQFPPSQLEQGGFAFVLVNLIVQPDGHGTDFRVVKSAGPDFDEQAIKTLRTWIFHPAIGPDGKPVSAPTTVEVTFRAF